MPDPADALPEAVEEALYEAFFAEPVDERPERLERLCRANPQHAEQLRGRVEKLTRGDRMLGGVREVLLGAAADQAIGSYRVLRVLGEGGFGVVYLAEQERPVRRRVALKVLHRHHVDERARLRFEHERQLLARLQHASIAQVYDAGVTPQGHHYLAMEYVEGLPITAWCDRSGADVDTRLRLFLQVCSAIHHAHQREVVHRDVKPSNVLVRDVDGQPEPKVIDFGIAKLLASDASGDATRQGAQIGTPGYMSPEQAAGESVDTRTDVYSLGVLLCELLTGDQPWPRERLQSSGFVAIARLLHDEPPRRPSVIVAARGGDEGSLLRRLRTDLDWIVLRAVAPRRDDRYTSVAALGEDVERHLRGEPVVARQHAATYLLGKFVRRHRVGVAVAAALLLAFCVAITGLAWGLDVAEQARDQAEQERDVARTRDSAARTTVAQLMLLSGDVGTATHYLRSVPEAQRDWEWRHLAALTDTSSVVIPIGVDALEVAWVDDTEVAVFPLWGEIAVWDVDRGEKVRTFVGWEGTCRRVAVDAASGRVLLVGDRGLGLWDLRTGLKLRWLGEVAGEPYALAWSADRKRAAVAGAGGWLFVVDVEDGRRVSQLRFDENVTAVAVLGDEELVVGLHSGSVVRCDLRTGAERYRSEGHTDLIDALLVVPQHDMLLSASLDTTIRAWQLTTGKLLSQQQGTGRMRRLQASRDADVLYACGGWQASELVAWPLPMFGAGVRFHGHPDGVSSLDLSPDGARLATVGSDRTLRVWPAEPPTPYRRLSAGVDARVLSSDATGERFATASMDGRITAWNARTLEPELQLETKEGWTGCALAEDVVYVAGRTVQACALADGSVLATGETNGRRVERMELSADRRWLAGGHGRNLLVWELPSLRIRHELELSVGACSMRFDATARCFVLCCGEGEVLWIDPVDGAVRRRVPAAAPGTAVNVLDLDDTRLFLGTAEESWALRDGGEVLRFSAGAICGALSPDGRRLATGAYDQKVRVWEPTTGDQLLVFSGLVYPASATHFVAGGERLIALSHRWESPTYVYVWSAPGDASLPR